MRSQTSETANIGLRPKRSATLEKASVPNHRPRNVAATKVAWSFSPNRPLAPLLNTPALTRPGPMTAVRPIS